MIKCIIVDDDETARLILKHHCLSSKKLKLVNEFSSAIEAIKFLNSNKIDLVFLDIHMPTFSGFDFLKTMNTSIKIVLTTSDKNFALEAFEYKNVIDYLVKPIRKERFQKSIEKSIILFDNKENVLKAEELNRLDYLYVNIERRLVKINVSSIYLIEAKGDYIHIKTDEKKYMVHSTLKKIEEKLPSSLFVKVHRSFILNIAEIVDIEDSSVVVRKEVVPISRTNKSQLMNKLNLL